MIKQYVALLNTEGLKLDFNEEAINEIAEIAYLVNEQTENIGARRLHTIMTYLLDDILFNAPDMSGKKITITDEFVRNTLKDIVADEDLSRYIL